MAGGTGQDPALAVHLLIVLGESLYLLQILLLYQGAGERGKVPRVRSLH